MQQKIFVSWDLELVSLFCPSLKVEHSQPSTSLKGFQGGQFWGFTTCHRNVQLCVVRIAVKVNIMLPIDIPRGKIYSENNNGPKKEPLGAPKFTVDLSSHPQRQTDIFPTDKI